MSDSVYSRLGIEPVINCATFYTRLGGSIMSARVADAMRSASGAFVDVPALQEAVGRRIAELTSNEAAYVSNGAAAGIALAAAACITGEDLAAMARLPHVLPGRPYEFIVQRNQRNFYDRAIEQVGGTIVEIGHAMGTAMWELDGAYSERTAGVFYFAGSHLNRQTLALPDVIEWAHARDLPVIVDAAAQVPPIENLWHFTKELGADLAIFSGGKGIGGPQSSGLVVGRADLIHAITLNGPPNHRIGRPMKVAKESMVGLLAAIEDHLDPEYAVDMEERTRAWNRQLTAWKDAWEGIGASGVSFSIESTGEAGEPIPRLLVRFGDDAAMNLQGFLDELRAERPVIEVVANDASSAAVSAHLLREGEEARVEKRIADILRRAG